MTWQPIETAPVGPENAVAALIAYEDGSVDYNEEFYREEVRPYEPAPIGVAPTHWMPVPKAPFIHERFRHEQDQ